MDAETRSRVEMLQNRLTTSETHQADLSRRLFEAEDQLTDALTRLNGTAKDVAHLPGKTEMYTAIIAVSGLIAAVVGIIVAITAIP